LNGKLENSMGKLLPVPYPGQSMEDYREQLVNFQKNYWSFLKPSKGGSKLIPQPPLNLIKKTKEMSSKKLSEHVEAELFNKEKRVIPSIPPEYRVKLNEGVDSKKVIKTKPVIVKESILGISEDKPTKKKKPYYRKRYNKPKPVEVIISEPNKQNDFLIGFSIGLIVGIISTSIVINLLN
jgi:hypothetical protein